MTRQPYRMKKTLFFCLLLFSITQLIAQQNLSVKSFKKLPNDLDARVNEPVKDQNGDKCAIIKVVTTQTGFSFDCGQIGIIKTVQKPSEIWVYLPYGAKRLTISHPNLGILRDYQIPVAVEKATVYELILISGTVVTTVDETIASQWVVITPVPADAMIYINEKFVKKGIYQAKLKPGNYSYRIEAPKYHTEAGKIEIANIRKELAVQLKPAFGFITITSEPETGATIMIDGESINKTTQVGNMQLPSGNHTIQVIKDNYQPAVQKVSVTDGKTSTVNFLLNPNFSEISIKTHSNAEIFINNESKGKGVWIGRLASGIYSLEARMDKYKTARKDIDVVAGEKQEILLTPTPIYGAIDVVSVPAGATIGIDGKTYETTPNTIRDLEVGEHSIKLSKHGYENIEKKIIISEGKTTELSENMEIIKQISSKASKIKSENEKKPNQYLSKDYFKYKKSKTIWLVSGIVSASTGIICYLQANKYYSAYQNATIDSESLYQKSRVYDTIYPFCFALTGLCSVEFIINFRKQIEAKSHTVGLYTKPLYHGAGLSIVYNF